MTMSDAIDDALLARLPQLDTEPAVLGPPALVRRTARSGDTIAIRSAPAHAIPEPALIIRNGRQHPQTEWPTSASCQRGDRIVVSVAASVQARERYVAWLSSLALPEGCTLAPCSADDGALHRLWCVAATRLVLPTSVSVEARHDLLGIRLGQLALAMGADTLSGPFAVDRVLPLAGVPRPTESTRDGLAALVRWAGCKPNIIADDGSKSASASAQRPAV
ncbi:MAG: hypothetical protein JKY37_03485 [Nannocystaceae bacterium]|nr:hypothetical protein [Nannocystaceae bacterium]